MTCEEIVDQAINMIQRRGQVSYRMIKRQFDLDDAVFEDLKDSHARRYTSSDVPCQPHPLYTWSALWGMIAGQFLRLSLTSRWGDNAWVDTNGRRQQITLQRNERLGE